MSTGLRFLFIFKLMVSALISIFAPASVNFLRTLSRVSGIEFFIVTSPPVMATAVK